MYNHDGAGFGHFLGMRSKFVIRSVILRYVTMGLLSLVAVAAILPAPGSAQGTEKRLGLVIGNGEYAAGALPTAANDAGLVAQTLQAAGFDVMGARDLDGDALRNTFRDFVDKVAASGPDTVAFVYLSGHGIQYEGENYFVPVDARIERDVDVPLRALRLSDYVRPLGGMNLKAAIVVLDAARESPFARGGQPLAGGLALVEPQGGLLYAFNAAPGTIGSHGQPPYGFYAQALAEMFREGGLPVSNVFDRVRLRVHEATSGAEVPWHASGLKTPIVFFERAPDAPPEVSITTTETRLARPIQAFDDVREAYLAALERDTLQGYVDFLRVYPSHPLAKRVHGIVAARREAITWRRSRNADTPEAYWSYLDRYPNGPHAHDARRRLAFLTAPPDPPPRYTAYVYDIPPPPPEEIIFVRRSHVYFADPIYGFVAPPPPPVYFLSPPPPAYYFAAPPPPLGIFVLPVPLFRPVPVFVRAPRYVAPPPPTNVVFRNLHSGMPGQLPPPVGTQPGAKGPPPPGASPAPAPAPGQPPTGAGGLSAGTIAGMGVAAGVAAGAAATVALPPSVQKRAATTPVALPGAKGPSPTSTPTLPLGKALPTGPGAAPTTGSPLPGTTPATKGVLPPGTAGLPAGAPPTGPVPPLAPGSSGLPQKTPQVGTTQPAPKSPTPPGTAGLPAPPLPGATLPSKAPLPPGSAGLPPGKPSGTSAPTSVLKQGAPGSAVPAPGAPASPPVAPRVTGVPPPSQPSQPPSVKAPPPRQERIDRAQQDRGAVERSLQQQRQQDLDRRRQEQEAQSRARQSQQQMQDLQRQRQQQQDAQRRQMEQQRQQQTQQQQQMRQQQEAQRRAADQQRAQQAQAQAQARAQAEAQARARAAQQQQQQQQRRPPCGGAGQAPCPK